MTARESPHDEPELPRRAAPRHPSGMIPLHSKRMESVLPVLASELAHKVDCPLHSGLDSFFSLSHRAVIRFLPVSSNEC